jgi:hypothetical protein
MGWAFPIQVESTKPSQTCYAWIDAQLRAGRRAGHWGSQTGEVVGLIAASTMLVATNRTPVA